jgi:hypothetical protein
MAFYVNQRQRTMLGALVPRRRLLGDEGDFYAGASEAPVFPSGDFYAGANAPVMAPAAPDIGTPTFSPTSSLVPAPSGPAIPVSFFSPSKPIVPAPSIQPAVAPAISKTFPSAPGMTIVFPSQGAVTTSRPLVSTSWLDQQMIGGVPNLYLAIGALGLGAVAVAVLRSGGRRRR